jgi:hypothetical protein
MGSDRARVSFDRSRQWRAVIAQQGRVSMEADWNEQSAIVAERDQLTAIDVIGPCASPDGGYAVTAIPATGGPAGSIPGDLTVSPGTLYLGGERLELDTALIYSDQPDWQDASTDPLYTKPAVPEGSAYELVLLLAAEQEVSAVEDPALADVALGGPDTAQRLRIQQHVVRVPSQQGSCTAAWSALESEWASKGCQFDAASMRLTSSAGLRVSFPNEPTAPSLCQPVATGGYLGAENQLLRVAIASVENGVPTIVWGFDDASFIYRVTSASYDTTSGKTTVELASAPVDSYHYPIAGQVVELLRDAVELPPNGSIAAASGFVAELKAGYEPTAGTLVLEGQPPADYLSEATSQLYVRVWQGKVAAPEGVATTLGETGVAITLSSNGAFHAGDFWRFALRPIEPAIVYPARFLEGAQPPDGPSTWACPLALISWVNGTPSTSSCVAGFDSLVKLTEEVGGCCTVSVRPSDVDEGASLGTLIAGYAAKGPATICLEPGIYTLSGPLVLGSDCDGLTIKACREGVVLAAPSAPGQEFLLGLIAIEEAASVSLEGLQLQVPLVDFSPAAGAFSGLASQNVALLDSYANSLAVAIGVSALGASDLSIANCSFQFPDLGQTSVFGAGIYASGEIKGLSLTGSSFALAPAPTTVPFTGLAQGASTEPPYQLTFGYLHLPTTAPASESTTTPGTGESASAGRAVESASAGRAVESASAGRAVESVGAGRAVALKPTAPVASGAIADPGGAATIADPGTTAIADPDPTVTDTTKIADPGATAIADPGATAIADPGATTIADPGGTTSITEPSGGLTLTKEPIDINPGGIGPAVPPSTSGSGSAESTVSAVTGDQTASSSSLALPVLHDVDIERCVFDGVTLPVLGLAQLGTIRFERNTIRECYGGIWLVSIQDTGAVTLFDQIGVGDSNLWTDFNNAGTTALLDRIYVLALAMGQVLPTTPPTAGSVPHRVIFNPGALQFKGAQTLLGNIFSTVEAGTASGTSTSATGAATPGAPAPSASAGALATPSVASRIDIAQEGTTGLEKLTVAQKFPYVGNILEHLETAAQGPPAGPSVPAGETGEGVLLRLQIAGNQIDAVVEDSYSGAGFVVLDLTSSPGSLLLQDNRIRSRSPGGQTVLVVQVAEAAVTGNIVANEVQAVAVTQRPPTSANPAPAPLASTSVVLQPTNLLTVPAIAVTGNVLVGSVKLPGRPSSEPPLPTWEALNTVAPYSTPTTGGS